MSAPTDPHALLAAEIDACIADLAANAAPETVCARLRARETPAQDPSLAPELRARFLRARAVAMQRLGFPTEALGDLYEGRRLAEGVQAWRELAETDRAIAVVHSWRSEATEAALALLRSAAEAILAKDQRLVAAVFVQAGRIEMEIGHPNEAEGLISRALGLGDGLLSPLEKGRAMVARLQSLVAGGRLDAARAYLESMTPALAAGTVRLRFLADLEASRIAAGLGDKAAGRAALDRAKAQVPHEREAFEEIELAHAEAEFALAAGEPAIAEPLLRHVVRRCAGDDLAGRQVAGRLLHARALDALGRADEAERELVAALRVAVSRHLYGYADEARSRLAQRDHGEATWEPDDAADLAFSEVKRRFVRRRAIAAGGFGSVQRACDLELGTDVALKCIVLEGLYDPAERARLLETARTEIEAAARIVHPGVARVHALLIEPGGNAFLVQEFIAGTTLRGAMPIEPARALELLRDIAFALAAVHAAGIVHRDIKPENIVLRDNGSPVIVDFGIALIRASRPEAAKTGTRLYMAPEQDRGRAVGPRADLFSLGVIAYELLLGKRPEAPASDWRATAAEVWRRGQRRDLIVAAGFDRPLADLIARLLSPFPWGRPRAAARIGAAFADALARLSPAPLETPVPAAGKSGPGGAPA